jgi:hypothetical protein
MPGELVHCARCGRRKQGTGFSCKNDAGKLPLALRHKKHGTSDALCDKCNTIVLRFLRAVCLSHARKGLKNLTFSALKTARAQSRKRMLKGGRSWKRKLEQALTRVHMCV